MSWSEDDPGQGAPDGISALATMIGAVADAASSAQSNLQKLKDQASDAIWRGPAADAFHSRIDKLPGHLQQLATSYDDARSGFHTYAASVADIQQRQATIEKEISAAQTAHSSASQQQAAYTPPDGGASGTTAKNPYDDAVAAAASRLATATGKLHDLADDRRTADSKVKGSLKHAHNDGMKNKSGWAHFWDKVSTVLAVVAIVLLVVAVIAVCVAFPAAIAAFMAADGLIAGLTAGGAVLATAGFGGTLGVAMTVTGILSLLAEGGQNANGEGSLKHLLFDAALTLGPTAIVRGTRYLADLTTATRATSVVPGASVAILPKPSADLPKLQNVIDNLYKGTTNPLRTGDGTTQTAIRNELKTGGTTMGKSHLLKGQESMRALERILATKGLSQSDRLIATSLLNDLRNAMNGK